MQSIILSKTSRNMCSTSNLSCSFGGDDDDSDDDDSADDDDDSAVMMMTVASCSVQFEQGFG